MEAIRAALPATTEIELWWQDDARAGQKNKITRALGATGNPAQGAPGPTHEVSLYLWRHLSRARRILGVGAQPASCPAATPQAMQWHLDEISSQVRPRAHAVLFADQAGWHTTAKLAVPPNITLPLLPPRAPELNPVANIWQLMRDNWLSNRVFKSYDDIVALCCQAWNKLIDQPGTIMSIGQRKWAHGF